MEESAPWRSSRLRLQCRDEDGNVASAAVILIEANDVERAVTGYYVAPRPSHSGETQRVAADRVLRFEGL